METLRSPHNGTVTKNPCIHDHRPKSHTHLLPSMGLRHSHSPPFFHLSLSFLLGRRLLNAQRIPMVSPKHEPHHRTCVPSKSILRPARYKRRPGTTSTRLAHPTPTLHFKQPLVEAFDALAMEVGDPVPVEDLGGGYRDMTSLWEELEALVPPLPKRHNDAELVDESATKDIDRLWVELDALTTTAPPSVPESRLEDVKTRVQNGDEPLPFRSAALPQPTTKSYLTVYGSGPYRPPQPLPPTSSNPSHCANRAEPFLPPTPPLLYASTRQHTMSLGNAGYPRPRSHAPSYSPAASDETESRSGQNGWERYLDKGVWE